MQTIIIRDVVLLLLLLFALLVRSSELLFPATAQLILAGASIIATLPVVASAIRALRNKSISVDLLGAIALTTAPRKRIESDDCGKHGNTGRGEFRAQEKQDDSGTPCFTGKAGLA